MNSWDKFLEDLGKEVNDISVRDLLQMYESFLTDEWWANVPEDEESEDEGELTEDEKISVDGFVFIPYTLREN